MNNTLTPANGETKQHPPLALKIVDCLMYRIGKDTKAARPHDWLAATVLTIRDGIIDKWMASTRAAHRAGAKRVYYLSLEFLIGRLLRDSISNLGVMEEVSNALNSLGVELDIIREIEPDAALGNGGLGRLAACFMESLASLELPAYGYGIRYVNGMFRQRIDNGWQVELPETWLEYGNHWEFERRESEYKISFGGRVEADETGTTKWVPSESVIASAVDTPVVGYQGKRVNTLRLWTAHAIDPIRLDAFNAGDHIGALEGKNRAESLTRVLYPADSSQAGQELRLRQEYFFSSASIQDIVRRHIQYFGDIRTLPDKAAIQLNDTHPAVSVAELMRILLDVHNLSFDEAWKITIATFGYTNHTLLPEALESWPLPLFERLLPRHMQIIYAINARILREARIAKPDDNDFISQISLIDEHGERRVRMANLAFVGSHSVNGVAALHTQLMRKTVFSGLHQLYPTRINNKTNGITPRRWLFQCNKGLVNLTQETIGDEFLTDLTKINNLSQFAQDASFVEKFLEVKRNNKIALSEFIRKSTGVKIDPNAMFDVQIKRIHEYKRQLLNIIETIVLYNQIRNHPERDWVPRVKLFAGKAASSYYRAKQIIKLANDVARRINNDPSVGDLLKVVFPPNYNVSMAELIVPAADLSEQISTAGLEASGTGNMKLALNGALTIGTLDGANIEIKDNVGDENIFIFGKTANQVLELRANGYNPKQIIESHAELAQALHEIDEGLFSPDDTNRYKDLVHDLTHSDWFMLMADFEDYYDTQRKIDKEWKNPKTWAQKAILNTANMSWFSSDRTISEYATDIWRVI
jgi:glycogen phosphorylase